VAELSQCGWCGLKRPISLRLPDGEALCLKCDRWLRKATHGYPGCPVCKHRYWLMHLAGWGFRCLGCGLKFAGFISGLDDDEPDWPPYRHPFIDYTGLG
jgi:hypothetical protein